MSDEEIHELLETFGGSIDNPLPENLEDIRNYVNGEGRYGGLDGHEALGWVNVQYGFDPDAVDDRAISIFGDNFEAFLDATSVTLLGGTDIRDYVQGPSFTRLNFLIGTYIPNHPDEEVNDVFVRAGVHSRDIVFLDKLIRLDPETLQNLRAIDPRIEDMYHKYKSISERGIQEFLDKSGSDPAATNFDAMMDSFSNNKGEFTWAGSDSFKDTRDKLKDYFRENERENTAPPTTLPWEMRIGISKFAVPPINVNVYQSFQSGSLSGGALRQMNTPKFNSGHSETLIDMTLYFPNQEAVWGFEGNSLTLDVMDPSTSDEVLDKYLSSLRGLVTQFKYAPFLPLRNQYLNQVYDITAVALKSMTVSTLEGFPFCIAVNMTMQKFNHKVFLPTLRDFNSAIHWGRFRQYMIAAAHSMEKVINKGFLVERGGEAEDRPGPGQMFREMDKGSSSAERRIEWERPESIRFDKKRDYKEGKFLDIYFPQRTPARVFFPEYSMFRAEGENGPTPEAKGAWGSMLEELGYSPANRDITYDALNDQNFFEDRTEIPDSDKNLLAKFLTEQHPGEELKAEFEEEWKQYYIEHNGDLKDEDGNEIDKDAAMIWFDKMYNDFVDRDAAAQHRDDKASIAGGAILKEWAIPMTKARIDWSKAFVSGVSTTIGNNFARLQLQMEEDPVLQHIGGMDSQIDVNMVVFGESELIKWKRMFTHVNGLAMLEHAHGVLGFLGIKNIVTALCGIKYALPLDFNVETIPGFPRVYNVSMSFVDFDVEQQKREELSNEQQKEMTSQFSKKNPFLRLRQLWGSFNAYPDFPLSITDDEGNIVGHLDPDYYFRAFETWDDDILKSEGGGSIATYDDIQAELDDLDETVRGMRNLGIPDVRASYEKQRKELLKEREIARYFKVLDQIDLYEKAGSSIPQEAIDALLEERDAITSRLGDRVPVQSSGATAVTGLKVPGEVSDVYADAHKVRWSFGVYGEDQEDINVVEIKGAKINLGKLNKKTKEYTTIQDGIEVIDDNPDRFVKHSFTDGLTPLSDYQSAYLEGATNPLEQYEQIAYDARYRDVSGRMIRAFPTYMLWLIDEGGRFAGYKLFDNFYGLQSVIDFSVVQSEDILGDTLVIRLSNLYKKLTTPTDDKYIFSEQGDEDKSGYSVVDTVLRDVPRNMNSGMRDNYLVDLNKVRLRPGVRLHLRMGYGSNPNALTTVFNGVITQVIAGDIVEVVAQSDAIELSAVVNTTNEKGHSGDIDGAMFTGAWLSEPRDLMIKLLTMGTSQYREWIANANHGMVFSENKWGIRHFGCILYEPMGDDETERYEKYAQGISDAAGNGSIDTSQPMDDTALPSAASDTPTEVAGEAAKTIRMGGEAAIRGGVLNLISGIYSGLEKKRDYEIFKRNIYPGNGTGVAQYLGADALNGGDIVAGVDDPSTALFAGQIDEEVDDETETVEVGSGTVDLVPIEGMARERMITDAFAFSELHGYEMANSVSGDKLKKFQDENKLNHPIWRALGFGGGDSDEEGHDEVSFRASTYMKSVWDLFQTCAALLPNYIVAVRPFEDRSTVFYGKPHWLYTSGVLPLSLGIPNDGEGPKEIEPDKDFAEVLSKLADTANSLSDSKEQLGFLNAGAAAQVQMSPTGTTGGYSGPSGSPTKIVNVDGKDYELYFPNRDKGNKMGIEMHLPTTGPHMQRADLPNGFKYPGYMDPRGGERGGYPGFPAELKRQQENPTEDGEEGAFGKLPPDVEQYYINFLWDWNKTPRKALMYKRVLVRNVENNLACVCAVGERGPAQWVTDNQGKISGASPDVHMALGNVDMADSIPCSYGWIDDNAPLGPVVGSSTAEVGTDFDASQDSPTDEPNFIDKIIASTKQSVHNVLTLAADLQLSSTHIFNQGWKQYNANPWNDPWGSEYGNHSIEDWIAKKPDDIYTQEVLDVLTKALEDFNAQFIEEFKSGTTDAEALDWEDVPFGPDPVAIAARRYYDHKYNERVSYLEAKLVEAGVAGFQNNYEVYSISNTENFSAEGGGALESGRGQSSANDIWDQFRTQWIDSPDDTGDTASGSKTFQDKIDDDDDKWMPEIKREELREVFENFRNPGIPGPNGIARPDPDRFPDWELFVIDKGKKDDFTGGENPKLANDDAFIEQFNKSTEYAWELIQEFVQFMWQNPYARAWLVITTEGDDGMDYSVSGDNNYHFDDSPVVDAFSYFLSIHDPDNPVNEVATNPTLAASNTAGLNPVQIQLLTYLQDNNSKGRGVGGLNDMVEGIASGIGESIGKIWKALSIGFSGLFGLFEASLGNYGEGLERMLAMQKRTNILNAAYNDSIYYAAGAPGSLSRMADNPFTREYGEPVVEVREPFQRLHYINSFQHIIANQISENLDTVYTTITTTSDGNYPITVFFDKGSPPERQVEGFVESGIYWDNAKGSGFFGFLHPGLNILESARGISKVASGSSDELSSKRIGIYHLKESLKDIYMGEVHILGNADVRPWDLVYIGDVFEAMYGIFEVEQVVHHFTPETGFITSITPNALTVSNDPSRWSALSWLSSWMGVKNVRDDVRNMMITRASDSSPLARGEMTVADLVDSLQPQVRGQTQYTHGSSAMMKDLAGHFASGLAYADGIGGDERASVGNPGGAVMTGLSSVPLLGMFTDLAWDAWNWTKDTLADQQDCYILYLTKDGQPMDAGLSYNSGVAVGNFHSYTLLPGILGFDFDTKKNGNTRITIEDLLGKLGYAEKDVLSIRRNANLWTSRLSARILQVAGTGPDDDFAFSQGFDVLSGTITEITDADTVKVATSEGVRSIRLSGIDTAELPTGTYDDESDAYQQLPEDHVGKRAKEYLKSVLYIGRPVAIRFSTVQDIATHNREAGVIFHNVPANLGPEEAKEYLEQLASAEPTIPWDSYLDDGRPYTVNWELVMAGFTPVNYPVFSSSYNESDRGADPSNPVGGN